MIGKLSGIIDSIAEKSILLDVQGVGYIVHASSRTLSRIGGKGEAAQLYIELQVREDSLTMFGFIDSFEQDWFKLLCSVQGVGAKVGLAILSACPPDSLAVIIASQDKAAITRADGVGPKLATRILTELKDKAASIAPDFVPSTTAAASNPSTSPVPSEGDNTNTVRQDAISALTNLGYSRGDAYGAVMAVVAANDGGDVDLQDLIRLSLKELSA